MVNVSRRRAVTARRLILLATMANLGIAAVVVGGAAVPAFSNAQAAERPEGNSPFPPNSRMEQFFRRFGMPDAGRDNWWQQDLPFPQNSQIERFFRGFGNPDAGRDTRGWMGVQIQPITAEIADSLGMKTRDGALVVEAQEGSPAAKAGIMSGDVITAVNGTAVKDARDLAKAIGAMSPGTTAKLTVWRKGEEKSLSVTLGDLPKDREARAATPGSGPSGVDVPKLGLMLTPAGQVAGSGPEGVVVTQVEPNGLAAEHGLKTGDVILDVGGKKVATAAEVRDAIGDAQKDGKRAVLIRLKSDNVMKFVAIPIAGA